VIDQAKTSVPIAINPEKEINDPANYPKAEIV